MDQQSNSLPPVPSSTSTTQSTSSPSANNGRLAVTILSVLLIIALLLSTYLALTNKKLETQLTAANSEIKVAKENLQMVKSEAEKLKNNVLEKAKALSYFSKVQEVTQDAQYVTLLSEFDSSIKKINDPELSQLLAQLYAGGNKAEEASSNLLLKLITSLTKDLGVK